MKAESAEVKRKVQKWGMGPARQKDPPTAGKRRASGGQAAWRASGEAGKGTAGSAGG
ncbi:MAG TPA: hypothetical protein VMW16_06075 [Sedimentisphaerales bacterium]|nr:hypothetical protein [Sedimentisphaerales bacterium]